MRMNQYIKVEVSIFLFNLILGIKQNFTSRINLCGWHVQKNLISHLSSLGKKNRVLYQKAISLPFVTNKEKFENIFEELEDSADISEKQMKYLQKRYDKRQLWAKSYLKSYYGGGISTTSRVESFHSKLKQSLTSSSSLQKVFSVFRELEMTTIEHFKEEFLRHGEINSFEKIDFVNKIKEEYSHYISQKILSKFLKALNYSNEQRRNLDSW